MKSRDRQVDCAPDKKPLGVIRRRCTIISAIGRSECLEAEIPTEDFRVSTTILVFDFRGQVKKLAGDAFHALDKRARNAVASDCQKAVRTAGGRDSPYDGQFLGRGPG